MSNIGKPVKRHQVMPLENPATAPEGPKRDKVSQPTEPMQKPKAPTKAPERNPA